MNVIIDKEGGYLLGEARVVLGAVVVSQLEDSLPLSTLGYLLVLVSKEVADKTNVLVR